MAADYRCGTIVTMTTDSLRNVKDRFSEFVDRVSREHDRIVITRNGRPTAVLISLEETLELLGDQDAIRELVEAEAAVAAGDVVSGVDAVRALRPASKP